MSSPLSHDEHIGRILQAIERGPVSQRALSRDLGIALGLTNLLVRRLATRGLIRVARIKPRRVRYLLTPAGIAEKTRMSQVMLRRAVDRFRVARGRVQETFETVSRSWPNEADVKPVMFYGSGEMAEIGFVCLQDSDLELVGVFDDAGKGRFFGVAVHTPDSLSPSLLAAAGHARLIVMSLRDRDVLARQIACTGIPPESVFWT